MTNLFSEDMRRDPFPLYRQMRQNAPVFQAPPPFDMWMIFDYEGVRRAVSDHTTFSSRVPAPENWFIFFDPPQHTKLRGLISRAFTPKTVANLAPRIREVARELLDKVIAQGSMDFAEEFAVPLPMMVIAEMIGIPSADWQRFRYWSDVILKLSYTMAGMEADPETAKALDGFRAVTKDMEDYLAQMISERQREPRDDLLTRLVEAEVDGEHLTPAEILGFFQLLVVGGQETTANLLNNAMLCFMEHPAEFERLRASPALLPLAIEEVLRYRSPLQWIMRTPTREAELGGQVIPPGKLVLAMIGSANRDDNHFRDPDRFDITRDPNPHVAFGHGIHACLGAALSRLEARVALSEILGRVGRFELASDHPWEPRKALHVHGPARLPIRFQPA